jgi:Ser/Thr protein kinase RdoA (MazF antagonist)
MHPELSRRFNDSIRDEAGRRFGIEPSDLDQLNAFENHVYEGTNSDGTDLVLRISHSTRRTLEYTQGEIEFVRYLGAAGISIAQPQLSEGGAFIEKIADPEPGHYFVVTAFERAAGVVFDDVPALKTLHWKPPLFRDLGKLFAQLHNRAQTYKLSNPKFKRQEWYEYDVVDIDRFAPPGEQLVRERAWAIVDRLKQLPTDPSCYGLIHADLHPHNFCYDEGKITAFDFDNAEYGWFVKDIATLLFYVARGEERGHREAAVDALFKPFLEGYRALRPLDRDWLQHIPDMLKLQRASNYALLHQYKPDELDDNFRERQGRFVRDIEGDIPVIELDFASY